MKREIIYKYTSYEDALKIIGNNSIVVNNPLNYNDPFDCIIDFDTIDEKKTIDLLIEVIFVKEMFKLITSKEIKLKWHQKPIIWFDGLMYKFMLWGTKKKRFYHSNPIFKMMFQLIITLASKNNEGVKESIEIAKTKFIEEVLPQIKNIRNSALVSCFSKKSNSILMWGHYGDKHTGVCIGFERPDNDFYDLIYSKKRTKFPLYDLACIISSYILTDENPDINDKNIIKKGLQPFLTKSNDWAYEKEVRCLFSMKSSDQFTSIGEGKYLYIMPTSITEIYLGCKIDKDNKENITRIAKEKNIKVYQYLASSDKYELIVG